MVAIKTHQADSYVADPQANMLAYLVYGTDEGRVAETALSLARNWSARFGESGDIIRLDDRAMADNPDIVAIEIRSVPMFGGRSVVRVTAGNRLKAELVAELIELKPQNLLIIEAGNLKPSSPLRKLFEKHKQTAAIACFPDETRDITRLVNEVLGDFQLSNETRTLLISSLGSDRGVSRQELNKLALYAEGSERIEPDDILAIIGDSSQLAYDLLITSILSGDSAGALARLERLLASGEKCAGLLTVLARHLGRLFKARTMMESGKSAGDAVAALRPPVHFKQKNSVIAQVSQLDLVRLKTAIHQVQETTWRTRTQSSLERIATERLILMLSRLAKQRR